MSPTPHLPPLRARAWPGGPLIVGSAAYVVAVVEAEREAATFDVAILFARTARRVRTITANEFVVLESK